MNGKIKEGMEDIPPTEQLCYVYRNCVVVFSSFVVSSSFLVVVS